MLQSAPTPTVAVTLLGVLTILLAWLYLRERGRVQDLRSRLSTPGADEDTTGPLAENETAIVRLLVDLTRLTERLQDARDTRDVPQVIVDLAQGTFEAEQVVVLFVRRNSNGPEVRPELVVGATSAGAVERALDELLPFGEGEIGWVGQAQRAVDRSDLDEQGVARHATVPGLRSFRTDLAAPMVVGGETLGVVAVAGIGRHFANEKAILTLVAQIAGFGLSSAASHHKLQNEAELDGLTLILNRRATTRRLADMYADAEAGGKGLGLVMLDIDHFKDYNDRNGHAAGDRILQELAGVVSRSIRGEDVFGRMGGEEFLVVAPGHDVASIYGLAEKLRRTIEEHRFQDEEGRALGRVTVSGGVAAFPGDAQDSAELIRQADEALYRAKEAGRNRIEVGSARGVSPATG